MAKKGKEKQSANMKKLIKFSKQVNKLDIADEIDLDQDEEELQDEFIDAVGEIDDKGKVGKLSDRLLDFYEGLLPEDDDDNGDDDNGDDDNGDVDLDDMSPKELKAFVKDQGIKLPKKFKKITKKNLDDVVEAVEEILEEKAEAEKKAKAKAKKDKAKAKGKKDKKGTKGKKDKKGKKSKEPEVDLPKGLRRGTLPALVYAKAAAGDGECTLGEIAEMVAKEKDMEVKSVFNWATRILTRQLSKRMTVILTYEGGDESEATVQLEMDE